MQLKVILSNQGPGVLAVEHNGSTTCVGPGANAALDVADGSPVRLATDFQDLLPVAFAQPPVRELARVNADGSIWFDESLDPFVHAVKRLALEEANRDVLQAEADESDPAR